MKTTLATEIGTIAFLRIYVPSGTSDCAGATGRRGAKLSYHNAKVAIATTNKVNDHGFGGVVADYEGDPRWPARCDGCKKAWDELGVKVKHQVFHERRWDTESGELSPGCMFFATWEHWEEKINARVTGEGKRIEWGAPTDCPHGWSDCDGRHLHAICPDGHEWDLDGRASNCTMPEDQEHRCWVRSGEPPNVTAGKNGNTCAAGAGSIATPNWHGFLRRGEFV